MSNEMAPASFHLKQGKRYRLRLHNASDDIHPVHLHRHSFELTSLAGDVYKRQSYSRTPLQDLFGIITPSSLHYEVHHSGVPDIDPRSHEVMIHGLVERPLIFTMEDFHRFPAVSRIHFLECAGNSGGEQIGRPAANPQRSHGLLSCSCLLYTSRCV